jgi:hypothetical protein
MFNHHKPDAKAAKPIAQSDEPVHQFDQTNGVMKNYDMYESRKRGEDPTLVDFDGDEQTDKLFRSAAIGGMLGGMN